VKAAGAATDLLRPDLRDRRSGGGRQAPTTAAPAFDEDEDDEEDPTFDPADLGLAAPPAAGAPAVEATGAPPPPRPPHPAPAANPLAAFRALLTERHVSPLCLWEREATKLAADPRFSACPGGARGRKEAFEAWCRDQAASGGTGGGGGRAVAAPPAPAACARAAATTTTTTTDGDRKRERAASAARAAAKDAARRREADAARRLAASAHGRAAAAFATLLAEEKVGPGEAWSQAWAARLAGRGGASLAPLGERERERLFVEHVRGQGAVVEAEQEEGEAAEEEGEAPPQPKRARVEDAAEP